VYVWLSGEDPRLHSPVASEEGSALPLTSVCPLVSHFTPCLKFHICKQSLLFHGWAKLSMQLSHLTLLLVLEVEEGK
jgi:hypothetical protein